MIDNIEVVLQRKGGQWTGLIWLRKRISGGLQ